MVRSNLLLSDDDLYFWSDSKVTLAWIHSADPRRWCTFVANRVAEIQRHSSPSHWCHVAGKENPADLASRGTTDVSLLDQSSLWQSGPEWLIGVDHWPVQPDVFLTSDEERKSTATVVPVTTCTDIPDSVGDLFPRLNSWRSISRVTAWILRWRHRDRDNPNSLSVEEVSCAQARLVCLVQRQSFSDDVVKLQTSRQVSKSSRLRDLDPFLDDDNIIRVGGRLRHSALDFVSKHPPILPFDHPFSKAITLDCHLGNLHAGVDLMVSQIRKKYWIVKCRRLCRDVKTKCIICKRHDSNMPVYSPKCANLPVDRVNLSTPFASCGIDYAGPFTVRTESSLSKVYVLLFVCSTTRALHVEVTDSLTTVEFIQAFRKFCARYCVPKIVRSDNALTFKRASVQLRVDWRFNCPRAPWWGGFYERFVQLLKRPMRKVLGGALLTRKEFECTIIEVERCVNIRPLTMPSDDKEDMNPITPASLTGQVFSDSDHPVAMNREEMTRRERYLTKLSISLKRRWQVEYISSLSRFARKDKLSIQPKIGDIVLLDCEKPRNSWPLAKIINVIPGQDGIIRMVKVLCKGHEMFRSVTKLLPLEINSIESDPTVLVKQTDKPEYSSQGDCSGSEELRSRAVVEPNPPNCDQPVKTRCGRVVKPKTMMDL